MANFSFIKSAMLCSAVFDNAKMPLGGKAAKWKERGLWNELVLSLISECATYSFCDYGGFP